MSDTTLYLQTLYLKSYNSPLFTYDIVSQVKQVFQGLKKKNVKGRKGLDEIGITFT